MKIKILVGMIFSLAVMALTGCGGGGGGSAPTVVSGTAAKGQFVSGTANIFGVVPVTFAKGALLKAAPLDGSGKYTADIGSYTGAVLVEVTGTYKNEATATQVPTTTPLRCAISDASGNVKAMVTPLTELAVMKMDNNFTKTIVDTNNANIAAVFKVEDITKTEPVDATDTAAITAPTTTTAHKNQALVLATVSQMVKNSGKTLGQILSDMGADISGTGSATTMADRSIAVFKVALFDFMASTNNKTGITDIATTPVNIGTLKIARLKISTARLVALTNNIGTIDFTFSLPVGVNLTKDALNLVTPGIVVASGTAAATGVTSISVATLNGLLLQTRLVSAQGFGIGEFVSINCTIPTGVTATPANFAAAINPATATVTDITGAPIANVTLSVAVVTF